MKGITVYGYKAIRLPGDGGDRTISDLVYELIDLLIDELIMQGAKVAEWDNSGNKIAEWQWDNQKGAIVEISINQ
jgi:hypothetical protein